ncbi:phosphate ABC transporter substrate-binding protein [Alkalimonas delamerensis]|uniref:Phosphate ABC transporter substrate-binding protein n=1 Tax=Alkalimonas delamerensis TaxID=265981 RepID=A0ABT9GLR9_9GAMM|nr:phosphate ABC transporter substrate-binding protein [Alkalimonas delamerensis]MDP4527916.1 phosphate ABC transporter substrate-binding protein [Alkalimonas delamerensis]
MNYLKAMLGALLLLSGAALAEISVIVHPSNAVSVDQSDLNRLFLGRGSNFSDGNRATPLNLAEGQAAREHFDTQVLNRSSAQLKAYWSRLVFTGKGTPPAEHPNAAAMKAAVASDPTAIGYIASSDVDDTVRVVATF